MGWGGAFAVVLTGLTAVGATDAQAASGLLALSIGMGVLTISIAARTRIPVTIAWSTPGAALLASAGAVEGGWPAASAPSPSAARCWRSPGSGVRSGG